MNSTELAMQSRRHGDWLCAQCEALVDHRNFCLTLLRAASKAAPRRFAAEPAPPSAFGALPECDCCQRKGPVELVWPHGIETYACARCRETFADEWHGGTAAERMAEAREEISDDDRRAERA